MPDTIEVKTPDESLELGVPAFNDRADVDKLYEKRDMTVEEIREVNSKFAELYPVVHEKVLNAFNATSPEAVDAVSPRAVVGGSQGIFMTPSIYAVKTGTEEIKSASLKYIFNRDELTSEERNAIDDIAINYNKNRERRPTI